MTRKIFVFVVLALSILGCGVSHDELIHQYNDFAIHAAQADLWNEAVLRWQQIIEIDPKNAKAYNNLGVAYEALEQFDKALAAYNTAITLDPSNRVYRENRINFQLNRQRGSLQRAAVDK